MWTRYVAKLNTGKNQMEHKRKKRNKRRNKRKLSGVIRANRKFEWFRQIGLMRYKNRGSNCECFARIDLRESRCESPDWVPLSTEIYAERETELAEQKRKKKEFCISESTEIPSALAICHGTWEGTEVRQRGTWAGPRYVLSLPKVKLSMMLRKGGHWCGSWPCWTEQWVGSKDGPLVICRPSFAKTETPNAKRTDVWVWAVASLFCLKNYFYFLRL